VSIEQVRALITRQQPALGKDFTGNPDPVFHAARNIMNLYNEAQNYPGLLNQSTNRTILKQRLFEAAKRLKELITYVEGEQRYRNRISKYKAVFKTIAVTFKITVEELEEAITKDRLP
jgi:hypothetical protein